MLPTFVHVIRVAGLIVRTLGSKPPPPPAIVTLPVAVASQLGNGLGLGDVPGLGDALGLGEELGLGEVPGLGEALGLGEVPGLGEALGLGEVPGLGDALGLGDGLALGAGPLPVTMMVACAPPRWSSIWYVPGTQKVNENDWPGWRSSLSKTT